MLFQEIKNIKTTEKILRKFGILLSIFLTLFGGISLWKGGTTFTILFLTALVVVATSLVFPTALKFIYIPWMTVATVIGWMMTRVILTILYYLVFTPASMVTKLLGKDLLDEKIEPAKKSYWVKRDKKTIIKEELEHQF